MSEFIRRKPGSSPGHCRYYCAWKCHSSLQSFMMNVMQLNHSWLFIDKLYVAKEKKTLWITLRIQLNHISGFVLALSVRSSNFWISVSQSSPFSKWNTSYKYRDTSWFSACDMDKGILYSPDDNRGVQEIGNNFVWNDRNSQHCIIAINNKDMWNIKLKRLNIFMFNRSW